MRRRRRSSVVSSETGEHSPVVARTPPTDDHKSEEPSFRPRIHQKSSSGASDEMEDDRSHRHGKRHRRRLPRPRRHRRRKHRSHMAESPEPVVEENTEAERSGGEPRRVEFTPDTVDPQNATEEPRTRSPFRGLRSMSFRPVVSSLAPSVFTQPQDTNAMNTVTGPVPRVRYGIRRTNSLPDRLSQHYRPPGAMMPSQIPLAHPPTVALSEVENTGQLSRTAAVILLLVSTALVAVCAEFMVDSINGLVETSSVNEIFIGLIILPIVGNAAEHVTAITVAVKNKMDLAIGVAVGSSIQIALFITPLVVIIGWGLDRQMTLYFTLFETVCLFVSAFITNFLVLDGRSNYLEGALLMSTYVIIAVVAFFYPKPDEASVWGA
jgi:Ca2+:H+ antiporter